MVDKAEYLRGEVELTKKRSSLRPSKKIRTDDKSRRLGEFPPFSDASPFLETARAKVSLYESSEIFLNIFHDISFVLYISHMEAE